MPDMSYRVLLDVFTGKSSTSTIRAKLGGHKIVITFGEIIIPRHAIDVDKAKQLADQYDCRVIDKGIKISIIPNDVYRLIRIYGLLSSASEKHREKLAEWFEKKGLAFLREIAKL